MNNYRFLRSLLCIIMMLISSICYPQEEYEYVNISSWKWSSESNLVFYSNTMNKLQVFNNNAQTEENKKKNTWGSYTTWLQIPTIKGRSYTISFKVKNEHNPHEYKYKVWGKDKNGNTKEMWHEDDIYWGLIFQCNDRSGNRQEFDQYYDNKREYNSSYTLTSSYNSDTETWSANQDINIRTIKIEYDGDSKVMIYGGYGSTLLKTFYGTDGLTWIGVKCGNAAQILLTDFKFYRQTEFGAALPEIAHAAELIDNKNYSSAISILTRVLNTYKGAIPYYYRARAYIGGEYYKSAIEDCDKGLSYPCQQEQRENLYFLRGFSKLLSNDDTGISDMRLAGEIGMRFLRENNLLDYKVGQNRQSTTSGFNRSQTNKSSKSGSKSSISANRTPQLRKTKK